VQACDTPNVCNTAGASFLVHDLIVVAPSSYQKGSFVATKDYVRLLQRLSDLLAPGWSLYSACPNRQHLPMRSLSGR
jgi:23S rRNA (cytosine1962-C5)-methyltransferase